MTNTTKNTQYVQGIDKLFSSLFRAEKQQENAGANLTELMYQAVCSEEIPSDQAMKFARGDSKKQAEAFMHDLLSTYSTSYQTAYEESRDKDLPKESKDLSRKQLKAMKESTKRAVLIASHAKDKKVQGLRVNKHGQIVFDFGNDDTETYALRAAYNNSKKHFGRIQTRQANTDKETVSVPLAIAAQTVANTTAGKTIDEFTPQTRKVLQDALISLLGLHGAEDANAIEQLYKQAAE